MTPNEYRQKHKRCATCKYKCGSFCDVMNKRLPKTKGRFCKVYKAKEFEYDT